MVRVGWPFWVILGGVLAGVGARFGMWWDDRKARLELEDELLLAELRRRVRENLRNGGQL